MMNILSVLMSLRTCLATTVGLLSGFFSASAAFSATPTPLPPALVGSYQGLLEVPAIVEGEEGLPFGRVEIVSTAASKATGKLVLIDKKSYPFNITLTANGEGTEATGTGVLVNKAATATAAAQSLNLTLTLKNDGTFTARGAAALPTLPASNYQELEGGAFKTPAFVPVKAPCPWVGAYTASFSDPDPAGNGAPTGSGYMTGTTGTNGTMMVTGKLSDGTAFTGSMKPSLDGRHFLFLTPYTTTVGGYFVTAFQLTQRTPDNRWHVEADEDWTKWKKVPYAKDKSHPAGFGPLDMYLTLAQWVAPVGAGNNVATILGIDSTEVFDFGLAATLVNPAVSTHSRALPTRFGLNTNNTFKIAAGGEGSPGAFFPTEWTKYFTSKLDPKTGLVTMTIKIEDTIIGIPPVKNKIVKRTVTVNGVMFQLLASDPGPLASGFGWVPATVTTQPNIYGGFNFSNIRTDPFIAESAGLAGTYTVKLKKTPMFLPLPDSAPNDGDTVTFTISSDLRTMTFHGRAIPLAGDGRPIHLIYTDAKKSPTNNLEVTLKLNFMGVPDGINANYQQYARPMPKQASFIQDSNLVKQN